MSFLATYPYLESVAPSSSVTPELEHLPVAVCVHPGPSLAYFNRSLPSPKVPFIVIVSFDARIGLRLNAHLTGNPHRQQRLADCPEWIYMDLNFALSPWHELWNPARLELARRTTELYSGLQAQDILKITRDLNQNTASVIALREDLRLHISAAERFQLIVQDLRKRVLDTSPLLQTYQTLEERVAQMLQSMTYQQETSQVILRQFENLLSLVRQENTSKYCSYGSLLNQRLSIRKPSAKARWSQD